MHCFSLVDDRIFFFQAEDGIRDYKVTGVQTCALPIYPGPRVWETFKARYELFQVGADGRPIAPQPWPTYDAVNPCGADVDGGAKTLATFDPFMDFNQSFMPEIGRASCRERAWSRAGAWRL